jgi:hypothetical protein
VSLLFQKYWKGVFETGYVKRKSINAKCKIPGMKILISVNVRFEVLMAVKVTVFWVVMPCRLVGRYQRS